jgi:hypothetical protein
MPATPPQAVAVRVVATEPTSVDTKLITQLNRTSDRQLDPVAYVVAIELSEIPAATSSGWALYLNDVRVPKYWQYPRGIYFKVYDPQFLIDHAGARIRFSSNGTEFVDTGLTLPSADVPPPDVDRSALPRQAAVLDG